MTAKQRMLNIVKGQTVEQLKDIAVKMMDRADTEATIVFTFVLNELEIRMPEKQFCTFCDSL